MPLVQGPPPVIFTISEAGASPRPGRLTSAVVRLVDGLTGLSALQQMYARSRRAGGTAFVFEALQALGVTVEGSGASSDVPATGPLVVVANHPNGAIDGLAVLALVAARRDDVRVLGNAFLTRIPELASLVFPVDVFDAATPRTRRSLRQARRWLAAGGALCIFPAGEVARHGPDGDVLEGVWHDTALRLARSAGAAVVTCAIAADRRRRFRWARRVPGRARLLVLPRLLLWARGRPVHVYVQAPVTGHHAGDEPSDLVQLRARTLSPSPPPLRRDPDRLAVAHQLEPWLERHRLARTSRFDVCWFRGREAPAVLEAIGRAREVAFRGVGEGTGREVDLDRFDEDYVHVCLWDRAAQGLAGAYRLGGLDELPQPHAPYTSTLFDLAPRFFEVLGPAIEVGRAFVSAPYQRHYSPLALLWSGIGRFVAERPHCRCLFGAVSVDRHYGRAARQAMLAYLSQHAAAPVLESCVTPRHPLDASSADTRLAWGGTFATADIGALDAVVARLDPRGRGVPVLLRQYLKLGARMAGASLDPRFSDVLDVLTVVDLASAPPALLRRFMGDEAAEAYLRHWRHGASHVHERPA